MYEMEIEVKEVKAKIVPYIRDTAGDPDGFDGDEEAVNFLESQARDMRDVGLDVEQKEDVFVVSGDSEEFKEFLREKFEYQHDMRQSLSPADWSSLDFWTDILQREMEEIGVIESMDDL